MLKSSIVDFCRPFSATLHKSRLVAVWAIFVLLATVSIFASSVDTTGQTRPRSGIDVRVTELMINAMRARDMGDMNSAELFWIQARSYRPSLRRPAWLDQPPEKHEDFATPPQEVLLSRIANMPYHLAKPLLEARLSQEPENVAVRQTYLQIAEANSDHAEMSRHRSILQHSTANLRMIIKYLILFCILVLVVWQVGRLYRDLRAT